MMVQADPGRPFKNAYKLFTKQLLLLQVMVLTDPNNKARVLGPAP